MRPFIFTNHSPVWNKPFIFEKWERVDSRAYPNVDGPCWVSNTGKVYNENINAIINPMHNRDGYCTIPVRIIKEDGTCTYSARLLSRTIMLLFYPIKGSDNLEVNHNDGDKDKNTVYNLSWVTKSENNLFAHMNGQRIQPRGLNHYKTSLTADDVNNICKLLLEGHTCKDISSMIGCSPQIVSHIKNGTTFKDKYIEYRLFNISEHRNMNRLSKYQEEEAIAFIRDHENEYVIQKDLLIDALLHVGYPNPDKSDEALIAYMRRLAGYSKT